ncbi:MAG: hypothetical protein KF691_13380 [Phycisphaeraceae bacterium]|nr:hypothetical protein [Phycisphaeraceae bacterium]
MLAAPSVSSIANSSMTVALQSGTAAVNWSLTCYTNFANTAFQVQVRIVSGAATTLSTPMRFFFNNANVHQTISGSTALAVQGGSPTIDLVVTRAAGTGSFIVDGQDSLSYTVINLHE